MALKRSSGLRKKAKNPVSKTKGRIQALLRLRAIERDGGCVLRDYPITGECGPYKADGDLILQAEHLVGRANSISYGDLDNIVCLCMKHHFYFKKQHGALYWSLIEEIIGPERWEKVQAWERDKSPHRMYASDWLRIEESLSTPQKAL